MSKRKKYSPEFKQEAVALLDGFLTSRCAISCGSIWGLMV